MRRWTTRAALIFLAACAALLCGEKGQSADAQANLPQLVVAHPSESLAFLPFYVARDKSFFDQSGVSVSLVTVGASNFYPALFSGETDAVHSNMSMPMTLRQRGQTVTTIGAFGLNFQTEFVISKKLADKAGITAQTPLADKLKILKGKTIAVTGQGAGTDQELRFLLAKAGLDYQKDVNVTYIPEGSTDLIALASGQIDGFIHNAPWYQISIARGDAIMFVDFGSGEVPEANGYLQSVITTTPQVIAKKRGALVKMMTGLTLAMRYIHQPKNLAEVIAIAQKDVGGAKSTQGATAADMQSDLKHLIATNQIPSSPVLAERNFIISRDFDNYLRRVQNQAPLAYSYRDMVDPSIAAEGVKAADAR
jgi:NitT/TauT family transport system substrate-binding protein